MAERVQTNCCSLGLRLVMLLAGVSAAAAAVVLALFYTGKLHHAPRYVDRGEQPNA